MFSKPLAVGAARAGVRDCRGGRRLRRRPAAPTRRQRQLHSEAPANPDARRPAGSGYRGGRDPAGSSTGARGAGRVESPRRRRTASRCRSAADSRPRTANARARASARQRMPPRGRRRTPRRVAGAAVRSGAGLSPRRVTDAGRPSRPQPPVEAPRARAAATAAGARVRSSSWFPPSSVIGLQIETPVSTERARVEDRVEARVMRDVAVDGRTAIPAGTRALGSVTLVERGGKVKERARLGVRFHTLVLADGTELPIRTEAILREGDSPAGESARKIGGAAVGGAILGAHHRRQEGRDRRRRDRRGRRDRGGDGGRSQRRDAARRRRRHRRGSRRR